MRVDTREINPYPVPGTLLDVQRIVGANAAYKVITTGQRLTTNAAGTIDLLLSYTPSVDAWWELDLSNGLLQKTDAAYHYCTCNLIVSPADADGLNSLSSYITQHSTVQTFEAHTLSALFKLSANITYQAYSTLSLSGGTWQYNQGSGILWLMGKAWAR